MSLIDKWWGTCWGLVIAHKWVPYSPHWDHRRAFFDLYTGVCMSVCVCVLVLFCIWIWMHVFFGFSIILLFPYHFTCGLIHAFALPIWLLLAFELTSPQQVVMSRKNRKIEPKKITILWHKKSPNRKLFDKNI